MGLRKAIQHSAVSELDVSFEHVLGAPRLPWGATCVRKDVSRVFPICAPSPTGLATAFCIHGCWARPISWSVSFFLGVRAPWGFSMFVDHGCSVPAPLRCSVSPPLTPAVHRQAKVRGKPPASSKSNKHPLWKKVFPKDAPSPEADLDQSRAKAYCPPGCSVWRANTRGGWHCHLPPHRRYSCPWSRYGGNSYYALLDVMRHAWKLFLDDHGLPDNHCPIPHLL